MMQVVSCINLDQAVRASITGIEQNLFLKEFENFSSFKLDETVSILIVHVDYYDIDVLNSLKELKKEFTSIAIIISSHRYIENLAFWCLHNKMLDYLVLPEETAHLKEIITTLTTVSRTLKQEQREPLFCSATSHRINRFVNLPGSHFKTRNALAYINQNYKNEIRLDTLAMTCNYSVAAFSKLFKKEHGISAMEFVNQYRIAIAKQLLAETDLSVATVGERCGFDDVSYFVKVFKNVEKITPSSYRKNI